MPDTMDGGKLAGDREFALALARAFAGAVIFAFPLLMTMEMWWLGFYMDPIRLSLFLVLSIPVLMGLSYYSGFRRTFSWWEDLTDALGAFAVGAVASALLLAVFGIIVASDSLREIVGKIAIQTVPAAIGAMLARKQLGRSSKNEEQNKAEATYFGALFLMMAGALFVAFNVAPTEEMVLIAYKMTPWHGIALILGSVLMLHAFVYGVGFIGQERASDGSFLSIFLRFTVAGYGVALIVSLYVLWTFGRLEGLEPSQIVMPTVVLGFPAALGAATARLIL
ncbi:MAG TPA: TIGR02587 family membrane protein [Arenibaculum sp.]|nr:TIGR02587 family membrane protein [Arenibaculum sp.]